MERGTLMNNEKPKYHIVSLSGGKDSTAMLIMMVERNMPIDLILFCDTGLEFPAMYEHIDSLEKYIGIPVTRIKADKSFEYYMLEHKPDTRHNPETDRKYGANRTGYSWPGPRSRWCTTKLKVNVIEKYIRSLKIIRRYK